MRLLTVLSSCLALASASIWQNQQLRDNPYPGQAELIDLSAPGAASSWKSYNANASQLSYKGRWDSKHISWWSAPGLKFAYTGDNVAISFGNYTDPGVLLAWRIGGQDWQFANVTPSATYQFVNSNTIGQNLTSAGQAQTFEFRVTNWALGVQVDKVLVSAGSKIMKIPNHPLKIEIIGDSLSAGQYATYEGISSYSWGLAEGFGDVEFDITAYPGICLHDQRCYGNLRGQTYQWLHTSDTSGRAISIWGDDPEPWQFGQHQKSDIVVINLGTNDANTAANNVSASDFQASYIELINEVHNKYPKAQVIVLTLWEGFGAVGNTFEQGGAFVQEIQNVVAHFETDANTNFVSLYNTTGILQHNDIGPQYHPTDVGHVKVASHLKEYIRQKFGWEFAATGPEVQAMTLYWNDENAY